MLEKLPTTADAELEQLAALRAAIQIGIDDSEVGRYEEIDDTHTWVRGIADTVTTPSVA